MIKAERSENTQLLAAMKRTSETGRAVRQELRRARERAEWAAEGEPTLESSLEAFQDQTDLIDAGDPALRGLALREVLRVGTTNNLLTIVDSLDGTVALLDRFARC